MRFLGLVVLSLLLSSCYARDRSPTVPSPKKDAVASAMAAQRALNAGLLDESLSLAHKAWETDPDYQSGAWLYASILGKTGALDEALAVCNDLLERHPDCVQGHLLEGILWDRKGNRESANRAYDRALAEFALVDSDAPPTPEYRLNEAVTIFLRHGKLEGVGAINQVIAQFPDYGPAQYVKSCIQDKDRAFLLRWFADSGEDRPIPASGVRNVEM